VTFLTAVTAAFALVAPIQHANAVPNLPVIRALAPNPPRFVRLRLDVTAYGVPGRGEIVVDRATGHYVRRFDAGPVSEREGWDGVRPWRADATGMPRVQGNTDERAAIVDWARWLAPADPHVRERPSRAPEIAADPASGEVTSIVRHVGQAAERTTFADYRSAAGFALPFAMTDTSENGVWSARVLAVETPRAVPDGAFAPPREPRDATLRGVETVQTIGGAGDVPVIPVSVNGAPPLRFVLDTGGQNVISPDAARRVGLEPVGEGTVGGAGAALAKIRYAAARSVRVGNAEMRDQPFVVLDLGRSAPVDGIVGYELLARFAARIDLQRGRVELARDARSLGTAGTAVAMAFDERQPQVDGALDGIAGTMTIDTGSASSVDVNTPFVTAHDLRARYHADVEGYPISGVGGAVHAYFARANELRLGDVHVRDVSLLLTDARGGAEANPTIAANVGDQVLRRFSLVVDYRAATIRFEPPAR
jgi:Aspartyl protease